MSLPSTSLPSTSRRIDIALLVLRTAGLLLALSYGRQKLTGYIALLHAGMPLASSGLASLIRAMGLPASGLLGAWVVLYESLGASLVAIGLFTRTSAAVIASGMAVAFYVSIRLQEDAFRAALYCILFTALAIAGPGRYSLDSLWLDRPGAKKGELKSASLPY
jgi:uncharacterized membrane protein YphA (DoxX/SURF4 family)